MPMHPEEAAAPAAEGPAQAPGGGAAELVQKGGEILSQLAQLLDSDPSSSDEDRAQMSQIMDLYVNLAEKKLSGGAPEEAAPSGPMPMAQGQSGKPMGPNTRQ